MKAKHLRAVVREEVEAAVNFTKIRDQFSEYDPTYSTLTIHFAPGSDPAAVSIPYQRWRNRAEVTLPLLVMSGEALAAKE